MYNFYGSWTTLRGMLSERKAGMISNELDTKLLPLYKGAFVTVNGKLQWEIAVYTAVHTAAASTEPHYVDVQTKRCIVLQAERRCISATLV